VVAVTGPDDNDLRNASLGRLAASITGPWLASLQQAVAAQAYEVQAAAMGASPEKAERVLGEVITELSQTVATGDPYDIAWHRLATGEDFRPPEPLREAARQLLAAHGASLHPEDVDAYAWKLQHLTTVYAPRAPWYKRWWRRVRNALRRKKA